MCNSSTGSLIWSSHSSAFFLSMRWCSWRTERTNHTCSHLWALEKLTEASQTHFQHRFSLNMWCRITGDIHGGLFVFEHHLTAETYISKFPFLWHEIANGSRINWQHRRWEKMAPCFAEQVVLFYCENFSKRRWWPFWAIIVISYCFSKNCKMVHSKLAFLVISTNNFEFKCTELLQYWK